MTITPEREREAIERVSAWANYEYTTPEQIAVKSQVSTFTAGDLRLILSSYKAMREALVKIRDGAWVEQDGSVSDAALDIQHLAKLTLHPFTKPAQSKEPGA
jgi:hypothetical protein